ncbi:MAG: DUF3617 domain-containing protein [Cellvibrionaceae bacterium]
MKTVRFCFATLMALLAIASTAAFAQPTLQPGLWEHSFKLTSQSGQIEAAMKQAKEMLEAMPPEQRQMIEKQMAANGINLDLDTYTTKVCITEAQAARNQFPEPNDSCTQTITEQSDDVFKVQFSCEGDPPTTGEGEIRLLSDQHYRGTVIINTSMQGQAERVEATQDGQWLSEDCGEIQPLSN